MCHFIHLILSNFTITLLIAGLICSSIGIYRHKSVAAWLLRSIILI